MDIVPNSKNQIEEKQNPFVTSDAALGEDFFGRAKEIKEIKKFLNKRKEQNLLIYGQRRIGKTSLLLKIKEIVNSFDLGRAVFFDLQNKARYEISKLLFEIAVQICADVEVNINFKESDFIEKDSTSYFKDVFLPEIFALLPGDRQLILLFDEFDTLGELEGIQGDLKITNIAYHRFIPYIEGIKNKKFPLKFIFAVGRNYKDLEDSRFGQITKSGSKIEIPYFAKEDLENLLKSSEDILPFEQDAIERLYELTFAHPFFSQCLASSSFDEADDLSQESITKEIVEKQFVPAIESYGGGVQWLWKSFTANDRIILYLMAVIRDANKVINKKNIESEAARLSLVPALHKLDKILERLINIRIIKWADSKHSYYDFYVEFFRKWIVMEFSVEKIGILLNEINPEINVDLTNAQHYYRIRDHNEAKKHFEKIIAKYPSHYEALYHLGLIYKDISDKNKRNLNRALKFLRQAYLQNPIGTKDEYLYILNKQLSCLEKENRDTEDTLREIQRVNPDNSRATERLVEIFIFKGKNISVIDHLLEVKVLNLKDKDLKHLPEGIELLKNLKKLDLRNNNIEQLPIQITQLNNLKALLLSGNPINIPDTIVKGPVNKILEYIKLNTVTEKDIDIIKEIEDRIGIELQKLDVEDIEKDSIGYSIDKEGNVTGLNLYSLKMPNVSFLKDLKNLKHLNLMNNQIFRILPLLGLTNITQLYLSGNYISDYPILKDLKNLTTLYLSSNKVSDISFLKNLKKLTSLHLSFNAISDISSLKDLHHLTNLHLKNNLITDISPLKELTNIKQLGLSNNGISDISSLRNSNKLVWLDLSHNEITDISPLTKLRNLTYLDLSDNEITNLPESIINMKMEISWDARRLAEPGITLHGNPLEEPPIEIVKQGKEAIRAYFSALEEQGRALNEVKILLVGDGGVGKTSLVKRLLGEGFDPNEDYTSGIKIVSQQIKPGNEEVKVNLWDFGGQEIMHATHQLFFSKRSLYILVLDGRRDEKTEYWLKYIESFGGNSPVIVVINKVDQNPSFDVNRNFLQKKYKNIKGFYRTSCATNEGIEILSKSLEEIILKSEIIETTWASSWFNVKERLEHMDSPFISYEQYTQICINENIVDNPSREALIDFLNDLGAILHFKEFGLKNIIILEPEWITEAIYRIINSNKITEDKGTLKLAYLDEIFNKRTADDYYYSNDTYIPIIGIMEKYEICYRIDKEHVLIPDLLPIQESRFDFDYVNSLKFIIKYDFFPRSVMPRFIIKMHKDIKDDLRWRTGVVLENKDFQTTAVIKGDYEARRIYIYVNGRQKRDYFATILVTLRIINSSFEKLMTTELVPMPDEPEITVDYEHLLRLEEEGIKFFLPGKSNNKYRVKDLLGALAAGENREIEILQLLRIIKEDTDTYETLTKKASDILIFNPKILGIGIDLNKLIKKVLSKKKQKRGD